MGARKRACRGHGDVPHLHNLVLRVDELDLGHVDVHGVASLFCLLSRETRIRRHKHSTSLQTPALSTWNREVTLEQVKSCLFSRGCLVYPPSFCSGRVSISSASLMTWPLPKQALSAPTAAQGGEEAPHSSPGLGTPAPNNSLSSFPSV